MAIDCGWQLVDDNWLVTISWWQVVGDNWLVTIGWWQLVGDNWLVGLCPSEMVIFEGLFFKRHGPQPIVINQLLRQPIATHQLLLLLAHLGPTLAHLGPMLCPLAAYVGPLLGLCWAILGLSILGHLVSILDLSWGLCWVILGYMLRHLR